MNKYILSEVITMQIIKRNQLIILVISLMLVTAGYLNFTTRQQGEIEASRNY